MSNKISQKRISIEYLNNEIDIVDRLNDNNFRDRQETKKQYEGFNFDFKRKTSERSIDKLKK